ncbi:MAG: peptidase S58 family protein, partial [Anaerolineae bacterium]
MAHDGIARVVRPAHIMFDGDTLFTAVTGAKRADVNLSGAYAVDVVANEIVRGVEAAEGLGCLPAHSDIWG